MQVKRQEYRRGIVVPSLSGVKIVLARAVVGPANWEAVSLQGGKIVLGELKTHPEPHEVLRTHIDEVIAAMELALSCGDYWFQSYTTPRDWAPVVRRIGGVYHIATTHYDSAMDRFASCYGQRQSLTILLLQAQFPVPTTARAGELVELDLKRVVQAMRGTCLAQFTAAQLATAICHGQPYPGEQRPRMGGKVLMLLNSHVCVLFGVEEDTVGRFDSGWRQKEGEPGAILVPIAPDTSTYEKEIAGAVHLPALQFTITGAVDSEIRGPGAFFGLGGNPGLPIVDGEHENYVQGLADDLERRLRAISP